MRIALVKPDWGITGGFELLIPHLVEALESRGHEVSRLEVPGPSPDRVVRGTTVPDDIWEAAPEFFGYLSLHDRFATLRVPDVDLVLTTQPGSTAVRHPNKLAVFYHHHRVAYDLADVYVRNRLPGHETHHHGAHLIREIEAPDYDSVGAFLTPSNTVRDRLRRFNSVSDDRLLPYQAAPAFVAAEAGTRKDHVLCVSRHEYTKRTELFVAAAYLGFGLPAVQVGEGGRYPAVREWAARLAAAEAPEEEPWWEPRPWYPDLAEVPESLVCFRGRVDDEELRDLYGRAAVVVAPAYDEDYGLTLLEAMSFGKPVVVCRDGGGLAEMIEDGVTGLVVDPTPRAVAEGVRSLVEWPERMAEMGAAARTASLEYTWERAAEQLLRGVETVMGNPR